MSSKTLSEYMTKIEAAQDALGPINVVVLQIMAAAVDYTERLGRPLTWDDVDKMYKAMLAGEPLPFKLE